MSFKIKISIIIPVYNTEKYLKECLDSVLNQTFKDFEVLLINDGSKDNSGAICDEYARNDSRFKVFHQDNKGVGASRNLGLDKAKGDWICFVDSDDELQYNALGNYTEFNCKIDSDIIFSDYTVKFPKYEKLIILNLLAINLTKKNLIKDICTGKIHGSLCNKLFNKKLFNENRFNESITYMEDKLLLIELLLKDLKVSYMSQLTYIYHQRNESVTNNISQKSLKSIQKVNGKLLKVLSEEEYKSAKFSIKLNEKIMLMKLHHTSEIIKNRYSEINSHIFKSNIVPIQLKVLFWFEFRNIKLPRMIYFKLNNLRN